MLNKRICKVVSITEAQAGARRERSSIDQSFILKSVIQQRLCEQKTAYEAITDTEKAYDNTLRDGMFYNLWKRENLQSHMGAISKPVDKNKYKIWTSNKK